MAIKTKKTTVKRKRPRKSTTKKWQNAFIAALRKNGNITLAAKAAKIDRKTAYNLRDSDEAFGDEWADALDEAADYLEEAARQRAVKGVTVEHYNGEGKCLYTETKYSDTLLIFLLKGARPEKFRERFEVSDWRTEANKYGLDPEEIKKAIVTLLLAKMGGASDSRSGGGSPTPDSGA